MSPSSTRTSATDPLIRPAAPADIAACRELFLEYQGAIGVSLCFQDFERELAQLPGDYAPPRGGLWLAEARGELAGCVAFRALPANDAEMKRLYVRPAFRGLGLGRRFVDVVIAAGRAAGYEALKLDTLPSMAEAQRLYEAMGFVETSRYNDNPIGGTRFLSYDLRPLTQRA